MKPFRTLLPLALLLALPLTAGAQAYPRATALIDGPQVATRGHCNNWGQSSYGYYNSVPAYVHAASGTFVENTTIVPACTALKFVYLNSNCANAITVKASIQIGSGSLVPVTFVAAKAGGANVSSDNLTLTIPTATAYASDWMALSVPAMSAAKVYTYWVPVTSNNYPCGLNPVEEVAVGGKQDAFAPDTDITSTGTGASFQGGYTYGPSAILGKGNWQDVTSLLLVGDSILQGGNDAGSAGYMRRACQDLSLPYISLARAGESGGNITTSDIRFQLAPACKIAIDEYGVNDFAGGTASQVETSHTARQTYLTGLGLAWIPTTITPKTTSTDGFVTTTNQARASGSQWASAGDREQFNAWVRAFGAGNYLDVAADAESGLNSGLYVAGGTTDGTHPEPFVHAAISARLSALLSARLSPGAVTPRPNAPKRRIN